MAGPVAIEWSLDALADLDRFAAFLHERSPDIAARVANELVERTDVLRRHPKLGRAIAGREEYRELLLQVLGRTYALQYRYDGGSILTLRVFHGREAKWGHDLETHAARLRLSPGTLDLVIPRDRGHEWSQVQWNLQYVTAVLLFA